MNARRLGRVRIDNGLLWRCDGPLQTMFSQFIPQHMNTDLASDSTTISGYSRHFDLVPEGQITPFYEFVYGDDDRGPHFVRAAYQ